MVRWVLRFLGWLLTPLVAWAASFAGATLGAKVGAGATNPMTTFWITVVFGGVFAIAGAVVWLRVLRRSRKLQDALALEADGTPIMALETHPPEKLQ